MKKIVSLATVIVMLAVLAVCSGAVDYEWNLLDNDFASAADYDPDGTPNTGVKSNTFVKQSATTPCELKTDNGVTYISIPSQASGNTLLEETFYNTADAKNISAQASADVSLVFQVRFRAVAGAKSMHFKIGSSNYRTVIDIFVNGAGNLVAKSSTNVIANGVNDGEWHVLTAVLKYNSSEDSAVFDLDGQQLSGKFTDYISRTDAPIMTVLLFKEAGSEPVDVDYVKISDGTLEPAPEPETTDTDTTDDTTTDDSGSVTPENPDTGDMTAVLAVLTVLAVMFTASTAVIVKEKH